jgi:hypothetical protein
MIATRPAHPDRGGQQAIRDCRAHQVPKDRPVLKDLPGPQDLPAYKPTVSALPNSPADPFVARFVAVKASVSSMPSLLERPERSAMRTRHR